MGQTAAALIDEQDADVVAAPGLEGPSRGVGQVAHLVRGAPDALPCLLADVLLIVQSFAHRGHGDTAFPGDVFHGNHRNQPLT